MKHFFMTLAAGSLASGLALSSSAHAADTVVYEDQNPEPVIVENAYNWSGVYVGIIGGGTFGKSSFTTDYGGFERYGHHPSASGGFLGGQIGYDWQFNNKWVVGAVADIAWTSHKSNFDVGEFGRFSDHGRGELDYLGTLRARVGYAAFDRGLIYAHGGWAYGRTSTSFEREGFDHYRDRKTRSGYSVGAGIEYAVTKNLSFQTEYSYVDLGRGDAFDRSDFRLSHGTDFHMLKAALNWRF